MFCIYPFLKRFSQHELFRSSPDHSAQCNDTVSECIHAEALQAMRVKDLPKVHKCRLEWDSNPRPSGRKASTLPMRHHATTKCTVLIYGEAIISSFYFCDLMLHALYIGSCNIEAIARPLTVVSCIRGLYLYSTYNVYIIMRHVNISFITRGAEVISYVFKNE